MPPSPSEWLPAGHLAFFILDVLGELDLSPIEEAIHAKDARGVRPYDPRMMVALLLYAYCTGTFSSRRIARATYEDVAFRVICGGVHPSFSSIGLFRRQHRKGLQALFTQVLVLCHRAGLVKLGHVAVDGTKMQGNASKHKAMSYERMQETEARLEGEVEDLLKKAEGKDADEDQRFGESEGDEDIPAELERRSKRLEKIRSAKADLEAEAKQAAAAHKRELAEGCRERAKTAATSKQQRLNETAAAKHEVEAAALTEGQADDASPPFESAEGLPLHRPRHRPDGTPHPKAQANFTDPDSRITNAAGHFIQGYNCQAAVDDAAQIIVGQATTNQSPDAGNFVPMLDVVKRSIGAYPEKVTGDAGYWTSNVFDECAARGVEPFIATERKKAWAENDAVTAGPAPAELPAMERMRWSLHTPEGRDVYAKRKSTVEPVFGQIKEARGFRRFLMRGLEKVALEWSLLCTTHNLLKLFNAAGGQTAPGGV